MPEEISVPVTGDTAVGELFAAPLRDLANMAKFLRERANTIASAVSGLTTRTDAWTWLTSNQVPQLRGENGLLAYASARERYLYIPAMACLPGGETDQCFPKYFQGAVEVKNWDTAGSSMLGLYYPLRLPHGAVVKDIRVRCRLYTRASAEVIAQWDRIKVGAWTFPSPSNAAWAANPYELLQQTTSGVGDSGDCSVDICESDHTIDETYNYGISVFLRGPQRSGGNPGTGDKCFGIRVRYEVTRVAT
jgi:hypothetical protein